MKSYFKFEITQTINVLLYKIEKGAGKRWGIDGNVKDEKFKLFKLDEPEKYVDVEVDDNRLYFTTVNGYKYEVVDKVKDGAEVTFEGPVNALLAQSLLPRMTYVPNTLWGKYEDMELYVEIQDFMEIRELKHEGKPNPQDKFGWRINMKFNNELVPWFPKFWGDNAVKINKKKGKFSRR